MFGAAIPVRMVHCAARRAFALSKYGQHCFPLVEQAWRAFDRAARLPVRVTPAAPILFFGDLDAYWTSPLRILTVGLNPSLSEYPDDEPFRRFPLLDGGIRDRKPDRYLAAMSSYFSADPLCRWFRAFEPLLKGAGSSYYQGKAASTALHTDICSPVATNPTWSKLEPDDRGHLEAAGRPLWHSLVAVLRPQVVALSVAKSHLAHIAFEPITEWKTVHAFERKSNGELRSQPYEVRIRWYEAGGERSLFVFGQAANTPFGLLTDKQKYRTGAIALREYQSGR